MGFEDASARDILEHMLLEVCAPPTYLPFSLLKEITKNFSDGLLIGHGGFATVYKGLLSNGRVAVKKLANTIDMDEEKFKTEVECLMKVKHKNIVRSLGYCSETQGIWSDCGGKHVMADLHQRLLCFEYLPEGSLDRYISDASCGLEWRARYQIIKGICEGLHYLHEERIVHSDLKPANILLDNMVPKIADFGLARYFDENQTRVITKKVVGSRGYWAPEYLNGEITVKSDIYSLGVVITEILTGKREPCTVETVLESWRSRLESLSADTALGQIRVCAEISIDCMNRDPANRPVTHHILAKLDGIMETSDRFNENRKSTMLVAQTSPVPGGLLDVLPQKLLFRDQVSNFIPCPVYLTNKTDEHVAFRLMPKDGPKSCLFGHPLCGLVPPGSACTLNLTIQDVKKASSCKKEYVILESSVMGSDRFLDFKELRGWLHEAILTALYVLQRKTTHKIVLKVAITSMKSKLSLLQFVSKIKGIKSIAFDEETSTLTVVGNVDVVVVVSALRKAKYSAILLQKETIKEEGQQQEDEEGNHDDDEGGGERDVAGPSHALQATSLD